MKVLQEADEILGGIKSDALGRVAALSSHEATYKPLMEKLIWEALVRLNEVRCSPPAAAIASKCAVQRPRGAEWPPGLRMSDPAQLCPRSRWCRSSAASRTCSW